MNLREFYAGSGRRRGGGSGGSAAARRCAGEHSYGFCVLVAAVPPPDVEQALSRLLWLFRKRHPPRHDAGGGGAAVQSDGQPIRARDARPSTRPIPASSWRTAREARAKSQEMVNGDRIIETAHVYSEGLGWVVTTRTSPTRSPARKVPRSASSNSKRQNFRLDAAVNNISIGLCMMDARGRLVICNEPYARIYNCP